MESYRKFHRQNTHSRRYKRQSLLNICICYFQHRNRIRLHSLRSSTFPHTYRFQLYRFPHRHCMDLLHHIYTPHPYTYRMFHHIPDFHGYRKCIAHLYIGLWFRCKHLLMMSIYIHFWRYHNKTLIFSRCNCEYFRTCIFRSGRPHQQHRIPCYLHMYTYLTCIGLLFSRMSRLMKYTCICCSSRRNRTLI